jgi:hypothetical protein
VDAAGRLTVRTLHHMLGTNVQVSLMVERTLHHANRSIKVLGATLAGLRADRAVRRRYLNCARVTVAGDPVHDVSGRTRPA